MSEASGDKHTGSVSLWIAQLKDGDEQAAEQLWDRYIRPMLSLARSKLKGPLKIVDEEDIAVSVFHKLCVGVRESKFSELDDRTDLWQILAMLIQRKCIDHARREQAEIRGGGNVKGESVFMTQSESGAGNAGFGNYVDPTDGPATAVQAAEILERLLDGLPDSTHREIAMARLAGFSNEAIAEKIELSLSSVERKLRKIRDVWQRVVDQEC